jgi:hypothetical protein
MRFLSGGGVPSCDPSLPQCGCSLWAMPLWSWRTCLHVTYTPPFWCHRCMMCVIAAMFSGLDAAAGIDDSSRKAMKRRLNPAVDLAAAAEDRLTSDGYGLAHNSARSELVSVQHLAHSAPGPPTHPPSPPTHLAHSVAVLQRRCLLLVLLVVSCSLHYCVRYKCLAGDKWSVTRRSCVPWLDACRLLGACTAGAS